VELSYGRGEQGKNIVDKGVANGKSDCYCEGALDQSRAELGEM